jgi:hypothetical protein
VTIFVAAGFILNADRHNDGILPSIEVYVRSIPESNVELIVRAITAEGIEFVFENLTSRRYVYGYPFSLYVRRDESWVSVGSFPSMLIGLDLAPMSTTRPERRNWGGVLESGEYKFSKTITPDNWQRYTMLSYYDYVFDVIFTIP